MLFTPPMVLLLCIGLGAGLVGLTRYYQRAIRFADELERGGKPELADLYRDEIRRTLWRAMGAIVLSMVIVGAVIHDVGWGCRGPHAFR